MEMLPESMKSIHTNWQNGSLHRCFSEELFQETKVFEAYYDEGAYFRLQQAYLAYVSREYVVEARKIEKSIIDIICKGSREG